jgi:hypothetical protein
VQQQDAFGSQQDIFGGQDGFAQPDAFGNDAAFGAQQDAFGQPDAFAQTDTFNQGGFNQQPTAADGFGQHSGIEGWGSPSGNPSAFGGQAQQYGGGYEQEQKWWQRGARIAGIAGAAVILIVIIIFIVSHNAGNSTKPPSQPSTGQQIQQGGNQGTNQNTQQGNNQQGQSYAPGQQPYQQGEQQGQGQQASEQPPYTQQTPIEDAGGWQIVGNTTGFKFVETRHEAYFTVQGVKLYYNASDGGRQVRHVAYGTVQGFGGIYEIDIPRSAVHINEVVPGYMFTLTFDVYRSADGQTTFLENLRPDAVHAAQIEAD